MSQTKFLLMKERFFTPRRLPAIYTALYQHSIRQQKSMPDGSLPPTLLMKNGWYVMRLGWSNIFSYMHGWPNHTVTLYI